MIVSPFLFLGLVAGGTVNFSDSLKSKKSIDNYNLFDTFLMAHVIMDKIQHTVLYILKQIQYFRLPRDMSRDVQRKIPISNELLVDFIKIKALSTVNFAYLQYNKIQHVCEVISSYFVVLARNCLASELSYFLMLMRKINREKGYSTENAFQMHADLI